MMSNLDKLYYAEPTEKPYSAITSSVIVAIFAIGFWVAILISYIIVIRILNG